MSLGATLPTPDPADRYTRAMRALEAARLTWLHAVDERQTAVDVGRQERALLGAWTEEGVERMRQTQERDTDALAGLLAAFRECMAAVVNDRRRSSKPVTEGKLAYPGNLT